MDHNQDESENLKIVYREVCDLDRHQQSSIDLLYNKLNWILVSDFVFLAAIYNTDYPNTLVTLLTTASAVVCLVGFQPKIFKGTVSITDQLDNIDKPNFLKSLIESKRKAFSTNNEPAKKISKTMEWSRGLLIAAIILQVILMLHICLM